MRGFIVTQQQAKEFEQINNVYVDAKAELYNHTSHDAVYGWLPIPIEFLAKESNK